MLHRASLFAVAVVTLGACGPAPYAEDPSEVNAPAAAPPPAYVYAAPAPVVVAQPAAPAVLQPCVEVRVAPCYIVTTPPAPPPVVAVSIAPAPILPVPSLDPFVRAVLQRQNGKIRRCYEHGLRRDPMLAGRVVVRLQVDHDGEVDEARDGGSTLRDEQVIQCVVKLLEKVDFNRSVGSSITYPLDLTPGWRG